jgi:flagellar biogenesis protein FliO
MTLEIIRMLAALCLTLGLLILVAAAFKAWAPGVQAKIKTLGHTQPARLKRLETLSLTPRHQAHVLEVDGTTVLAVTGPEGTALQTIPSASPSPPPAGKVVSRKPSS